MTLTIAVALVALAAGIVIGAIVARVFWYRDVLNLNVGIMRLRIEYERVIKAKDETIAALVNELSGAAVQ